MASMDGVLIIDKPAAITSHDVVARVRKLLGERRVGHTGTLDPFARGVLVVLLGRATRLAQFLSGAEKEYEAVVRLGYATDTGDLTGKRISAAEFTSEVKSFTREAIESALAPLRGEIEQTPPMFSAKKVAGQKLYELARRGEEVERESVRVTVSEFEPLAVEGSLLKQSPDGVCDLAVRVTCSAGTYVRTLAEDFGKALGVGAHLVELRRTRAGAFKIDQAISLERLAEMASSGSIGATLVPPDTALAHLPFIDLKADDARRAQNGVDVPVAEADATRWSANQPVRIRVDGNLIAVGIFDEARQSVHPNVVISPAP